MYDVVYNILLKIYHYLIIKNSYHDGKKIMVKVLKFLCQQLQLCWAICYYHTQEAAFMGIPGTTINKPTFSRD